MSTDHHDPLLTGGPLTAAYMEAPLGQLDAAIGLVSLGGVVVRASGGDDLATLQALADDATDAITLILPDSLYLLSDEWHISNRWVNVIGKGSTTSRGTTLRRTTNTGGAVVRYGVDDAVTSPIGSTLLEGGRMSGVVLDANSLADHALHIKVADRLRFESCRFTNGVVSVVEMSTLSNGGAYDPYNRNAALTFVDSFIYSASGAAIGMRIAGNPVTSGGENTYACAFYGLDFNTAGSALQIVDADDVWFYGYGFSGSSTLGIELMAGGPGNARNCHFFGGVGLTGSRQIIARATGFANPSRDNTFYGLGNEDTTGRITVEPGATVRFVDGAGNSTFTPDLRSFATMTEEFMGSGVTSGAIGTHGWSVTGANPSYVASEANHPGIRRLASATAGVVNGITLADSGCLLPAESFDASFIFRPGQADSDVMHRVGFGDYEAHNATPGTDGIYLEKLFADTTWWAVCRSGGVQTRTDTGVAVSGGTWVHLRIRRRNGTTIGFSIGPIINQADTVQIATNVPTAVIDPMFQVEPQVSSNKTSAIDAFQVTIIGMSR